MWEPKGESGYTQCLFGEREHYRHATVALKKHLVACHIGLVSIHRNPIMKSYLEMVHLRHKNSLELGRKLIFFCFRSMASADQPQHVDKTSPTTLVDLVEVVLSAYHQQTAAVG